MLRYRRTGFFWMALMLLISCCILLTDLPQLNKVPYKSVMEQNVPYGTEAENGTVELAKQGDVQIYQDKVSLLSGTALSLTCKVTNASENAVTLVIDLFDKDWDSSYCEKWEVINPGEQMITVELDYSRTNHPDNCFLRLFTYNDIYNDITLSVSDIQIKRMETKKNHPLINAGIIGGSVVAVLAFLYLAFCIFSGLDKKKRQNLAIVCKRRIREEIALYLVLVIIVTIALLVIYRNINPSYPFVFAGVDDIGVFAYAKTIKENGLSLVTPQEGGITGADMFDYPYSDKLSFTLVKIISLFTSNPYLTINIFYFLNFYLNAISATAVCRQLKKTRVSSLLVGVLYAFSTFIQMRYMHMWLIPYFMLPIAVLTAYYIAEEKFGCDCKHFFANKNFWRLIFASYMCAFTGMYYAFFSCAVMAAAIVIHFVKTKGKRISISLCSCLFIMAVIFGLVSNIVPNLFYWVIHGTNPQNEFSYRSGSETELYGLRLVQMLLPRPGHRIGLLSSINAYYNSHYYLVNENMTASLGLVAGVGFIISIFRVLSGREEDSTLAKLNLSAFLIGTIGGIGTFISVFINIPMRCYNRISLVIMFISLVMVASVVDRILIRGKRKTGTLMCACLMVFGVYDQTIDIANNKYPAYTTAKKFIDTIEKNLEEGDMVFELPYDNWPSSQLSGSYQLHIGYIESEGIQWSYGAMQGREEAKWQEYVEKQDADEMVKLLREEGYDGIYMDKTLYEKKYGDEITESKINDLSLATGFEPLISKNGKMIFWKIVGDQETKGEEQ